jgi:lipid-A-disaccharide synthase
MTSVLLSVGDASGDHYAADFVDALRERRPRARFLGLGGVEMEKRGVQLVAHQRDLAVGGLFELAPSLPRIARVWRRMAAALAAERPDLVVLVDSSGFNLPLARRARRAGAPVLYYVAPQVWAWRSGRIRKIARRVDRLAVIFPFEPAVYAGAGVPVEFVGHPLVDRLGVARGRRGRDDARAILGLPAAAKVVALLPGSRRSEVRRCLAVQLAAARRVHARAPDCRFVLPLAASIERAEVEAGLRRARLPATLQLDVLDGGSREALRACDVALCKPGTATLEAALLARPCVVAGRGQPLSAAVVRRLVKVDFWAMPNLIAGRWIVPEFLQERADPQSIADAVMALFDGPARAAQLAGLAAVRAALGPGGAAHRAAAIAEEMIVARARA